MRWTISAVPFVTSRPRTDSLSGCSAWAHPDIRSTSLQVRSLDIFFANSPLVRDSLVRNDAIALQQAMEHADTRFVAIWQSRCMLAEGCVALLRREAFNRDWDPERAVYLGQDAGQHRFALLLPDNTPDTLPEHAFVHLRSVLSELDAREAALFAYAKGMAEWHRRHRHCGVCGTPNRPEDGGFVLSCQAPGCGNRTFPRIDPAIIVLVSRGTRCLLGRQSGWPDDRYSTIAGFAEPGESLEDAVRREVLEETDVKLGAIRYLGSQPWPFPSALMIGFHAQAQSSRIRCMDGELADARWFSRADIAAGNVTLPPPTSIAFRLIEAWFDHDSTVPLSSLGVSGEFHVRTPVTR